MACFVFAILRLGLFQGCYVIAPPPPVFAEPPYKKQDPPKSPFQGAGGSCHPRKMDGVAAVVAQKPLSKCRGPGLAASKLVT